MSDFVTGLTDAQGNPRYGLGIYTQPVLNQANPLTTYVSPNTPQPAGSVPVVGATGTQSGQPVRATYNMPPAPDVATQARTYRTTHGLSDGSETDRLNAESLAAAQAGRTYFNPTLAAQYAQPLPAGVSGPRTDVVNALQMPPTGTTTQFAQSQPTNLMQYLPQQNTSLPTPPIPSAGMRASSDQAPVPSTTVTAQQPLTLAPTTSQRLSPYLISALLSRQQQQSQNALLQLLTQRQQQQNNSLLQSGLY